MRDHLGCLPDTKPTIDNLLRDDAWRQSLADHEPKPALAAHCPRLALVNPDDERLANGSGLNIARPIKHLLTHL
jgi:hypothetical protein